MMKRNLDGIYFRVERDGGWESLCFTDLTREEQGVILADREQAWLKGVIYHLADTIRQIGDSLDIIGGIYDE